MSKARIIRMFRLMRLVRLIRITRIFRFVDALGALVDSIMWTLKSLFWSLVLLFVIIYSFALIFTQYVSEWLHTDAERASEDLEPLREYWGTLPNAILTLFMSLSDGISWQEAAMSLGKVHPILVFTFLVYICFTAFAVLNVMTAVFVQSSTDEANSNQGHMVQAVLSREEAFQKICRDLFKRIDTQSTGMVDLRMLERQYDEVEVQALFKALEFEPEDAWNVFKLFDLDKSHSIDEEEFVDGIMKHRGQARRVDMFCFLEQFTFQMRQLDEFMLRTDQQLAVIAGEASKEEVELDFNPCLTERTEHV